MDATMHPKLAAAGLGRWLSVLALVSVGVSCARDRPAETRASRSGAYETVPVAARLVSAPEARTLAAWPAGIVLIDVRTAEEYGAGHLPHARTIPLDEIGPALDSGDFPFDSHAPLLVYCRAGSRSAQAAALLSRHGYARVYDLEGGITAWGERDYPIVR